MPDPPGRRSGIAGTLISFTRLRKPVYREPDRIETKQHKQCNLQLRDFLKQRL